MDIASRLHTLEQVFNVYEDIRKTTRSTPHDSPVWKAFQDAYDRDTMVIIALNLMTCDRFH